MSKDISTPEAPRLTWAEVSARRLDRNALAAPAQDTRPADVVARMCGAHAQVLAAAELSIGLRIAGATRDSVRHALWTEHSLVKAFGPRGTVHLLPARDLSTWIGALAAVPPSSSPLPEGVRLSPEQTDQIVEAMAAAVADAELTADELGRAIVDATGPWAGERSMGGFQQTWPRWRPAVYAAVRRGVLCFGPTRGRNVTYTSPRRWLPGFRPADGWSALRELVRLYLHAYGPATPRQFAQWLAAPRRWAAELFDSLSEELQQVDLDGTLTWVVAGDVGVPSTAPEGVRLLPYFDAYVIAAQPRERLFPGRAAQRALAGGQAGNFPVLLVDGTVAGVWHQRRSGRTIDITVEPLEELTGAQRRALDDQVERVGEILEDTPRLTIGTVTVGAHA